MSVSWPYRLALTTAASAALVVFSASTAGAALRPADTLSASASSYPHAASGGSGDAVVDWTDNAGLHASVRPAGGDWSASEQLSTPDYRVGARQLVVDRDGNATVVWTEYEMDESAFPMPMPGPNRTMTARRPAGGVWSAPEQLSSVGVGAAGATALAVGLNGDVVAVWGESSVLHAAQRSATGAWSTPETIPSSTSTTPAVAIDGDGNVTAAWGGPSPDYRILSATRPAGGAWSTSTDVSGAVGSGPRLAMTPDGDTTLIWAGGMKQMTARRTTFGGTWSTPEKISVDGDLNYYVPVIAVADDGTAAAAWSQAVDVGGTTQYQQKVATRDASGTWSTPVSLGVGSSDTPDIAAGGDGTFVLAVRAVNESSMYVTRYATRRPGGAWDMLTDVTDLGNATPDASVDGEGNVLLTAAPSGVVKAVGEDNAGPQLRNLSIPAAATTGTPAAFSVSPLDVWSALGATSWDFGDGGTATGTSVSHQFATPGVKTVTVTSSDAFAHETVETGAVHVVAAPTPPPPPTPTPTPTPVPPEPTPVPPTNTTDDGPGAGNSDTPKPSACVSRRVIKLHFRVAPRTKARRVQLTVTGQKQRTLRRTARSATIDLRGVTAPTVTVTVKIRTTRGKLVTDTRTYKTCGR